MTGDRYAGEWPREASARHGIRYPPSDRTKSDLYRELVAPLNAGRVELLDVPALRTQLLALERRVARGGKDSIDHPAGGRDDVANSVAGALTLALPVTKGRRVRAGFGGLYMGIHHIGLDDTPSMPTAPPVKRLRFGVGGG